MRNRYPNALDIIEKKLDPRPVSTSPIVLETELLVPEIFCEIDYS